MAGTIVIGGAVVNRLCVTIETGPKGKKVAAVAPDWPGLSRGAKTEAEAVERLLAYVPRYAPVAKLAGLEGAFPKKAVADVVERYQGPGSTDFWAISFGYSSIDQAAVPAKALERELTLLQACWAFFDAVRSRVSAELQKGPRGGGRDRDRIALHLFANEQQWAAGLSRTGQASRQDGEMAAAVHDPAHRLSHARSCLGNGRQGPDGQTHVRPSAIAAEPDVSRLPARLVDKARYINRIFGSR
jgi:hypothetical protein